MKTQRIYFADGIPEIKKIEKEDKNVAKIYSAFKREEYSRIVAERKYRMLKKKRRQEITSEQNRKIEQRQNIAYGIILFTAFAIGIAICGFVCSIV